MTVKRPAIGAEGFVLDHYDQKAIETHLHSVWDRLMESFGEHPPYAVFSDSLEDYGIDWAGDLLQQFLRRRGYDLTPHLLDLIADAGPETPAVLHNWGKTLTELANEITHRGRQYCDECSCGSPLPDYRLLNDRYGERFVRQDMDKVQVLPSGILGGLRLTLTAQTAN
jgi:glycosyl hydrolase family 106( putative alpha-L-rhamnosidase)